MKLDDVDFDFFGRISLDNFVIFNKSNDTIFFSPEIIVNTKAIKKIILDDVYDFDQIDIQGGVFQVDNFKGLNSLNKNLSTKLFIENIFLENFKVIFSDFENYVNLNLNSLIFDNSILSFTIDESNINIKESKDFRKINGDLILNENNIELTDFNLIYENSFLNGSIIISNINNKDSIEYYGNINPSKLVSSDFITGSSNTEFNFESSFRGDINNLFLNEFSLYNSENNLSASINLINPFLNPISNFIINFNDLNSSSQELLGIYPKIYGTILPSSFETIGLFNLNGFINYSVNDITSNIQLNTSNGSVVCDLNLYEFKNIDNAKYRGSFRGEGVKLSNFINLPFLGNSDFQFTIDGKGFVPEFLNSKLEGEIQKLTLNNYEYNSIKVFGDVSDKVFNGNLSIIDDDIDMDFIGLIDYSDELIDFDFSTKINKANIGKLNFTFDQDNSLSGIISTKLRGSSVSDLIGDISFSDFKYQSGNSNFNFDELLAQSRINNEKRFYSINSPDAVSGIIIGDLNIFQIPELLKSYIFSNYKNFISEKNYLFNDVSFNLNLKPKIASVINSEVIIDDNTFLRGEFKKNKSYELIFSSPYIKSGDLILEDIDLKFNQKSGLLTLSKIGSKLFNGKDLELKSYFINDRTNFNVGFYSKNGENKLAFSHTIDNENRSVIEFLKLNFDYNNSNWTLDKSLLKERNKLIIGQSYKELKSTKIKSKNQLIEFKYLDDENQFDFQSIFNDVRFSSLIPKPKNILYDGTINGNISLKKINEVYSGESNIKVENLSSNGYVLGDGLLEINNSELFDKYDIQFAIVKNDLKIFDLNGFFKINDNDYPIDLEIKTKNFLIEPFSAIGENVLQNFKGHFDSDFKVIGSFYQPNFQGYLKAINSSFDVPYLGVRYGFPENPSFILDNMTIIMNDFKIKDTFMKTDGFLSGQINHNRLKDWFLDFNIKSENILAFNTNKDTNNLYFGLALINGSAKFFGPGKDLDINISGKTNSKTKITIPIKYDDGVGNLSYLKFSNSNNQILENLNQGLEVHVDLKVNNNAELDIIFDENSGSKISGRGEGDFIFKSDYSGNFIINGDFVTDVAKYHFKNFGFVERIFEIKKGANIIWDGDPYKGIINAEAIYEVPGGANPASLIQNASFNRKIPTFVNVILEGELANLQTPKFNITFPNTRGSIKSELEYYLNDYENKQTQAISLISQGFFTESGNNSLVSSQTITNNLFQRASGIIDEIFTNPDDKMNVGINFSQGDKFSSSSLLNRDRIGLSLQSEISDKILINGKIGVPVSGTEENVILGDVQIEFLLNDTGNLKARIFNKENEYQFFGDEIGYTQGIGISYDVEFDSFSELIQKIRKKKKK